VPAPRCTISRHDARASLFAAGLGATLVCMAIFGAIAEDVVMAAPLVRVDAAISGWLHDHVAAGLTGAGRWMSMPGSTPVVTFIGLYLASIFGSKRQWAWLLGLVLAVPGGIALNLVLKHAYDRARPGWADPLLLLEDSGFPSGHTMMATITFGFIAARLMPHMAAWCARLSLAGAALFVVMLVALGRMLLGAHYLSDVLAAMAAGGAWLAFALTVMRQSRP
jgi:undecaprenyl-diphosphatase